jgi:hypothetical protein
MEANVKKEQEEVANQKAILVQQETAKINNLAEIAEKANKTAEMQLSQVKSKMDQELKLE